LSKTYSISDLAQELDITTRAIRFYEEQGMLAPERRGQERIFSARDRVTLKLILRGKRIGFSLAECKDLIGMYDPAGNRKQLDQFMQMIHDRREQLAQQILQGLGIDSGVQMQPLVAAGQRISQVLGRANQSRVAQALLAKAQG